MRDGGRKWVMGSEMRRRQMQWKYVSVRKVEVKSKKKVLHSRQNNVLIRPDSCLIPPQRSLSSCTKKKLWFLSCSFRTMFRRWFYCNRGGNVIDYGLPPAAPQLLLHHLPPNRLAPKSDPPGTETCCFPVEKLPNGACYIWLVPPEWAFASEVSVSAKLLSEDPFALRELVIHIWAVNNLLCMQGDVLLFWIHWGVNKSKHILSQSLENGLGLFSCTGCDVSM